ncbi:DUF11 domain-containing protein, partial [Streptomyces tsukubensis]|uniref:DUF11 domain-containing protein n=1 Tax=Streptomyces tsukubensis TaxID=83656 RepID=UPI00344FB5B7
DGPSNSTGYTVTDTIPADLNNAATTTAGCSIAAGTLSCTGGPLAVGASTTIALTGTAAADATSIVNTADVTGNEPDPNPANNTDSITTTVTPEVDLAVVKSGPEGVDAGDAISYTITVTNNGPSDSSGWTLTDPVPAQVVDPATTTAGCSVTGGTLSCTGGPLLVGASATVTVSGTVAANATGSIANTATVTGNEPDPNPDNNQSTATTVISEDVDLALSKTGPATVDAGDTVSYTITVTNDGPSDSSGWTVTDTVPAGLTGASSPTSGCSVTAGTLSCTGGPLAVGASTTITLTGTAAEGISSITNTATVTGNEPDPNPGNNSDSVTTSVTGTPGLTIVKKQNGPATVKAGESVEYTITVTNTGTTTYTAADPATFTDDLSDLLDDARYNQDAEATSGTVDYEEPVLSWSGALAPGQSATITFSITTNARPFGDLKLLNTVVSTSPGSNCAPGSTDTQCTTKGKVDVRDKDKDKDTKRAQRMKEAPAA